MLFGHYECLLSARKKSSRVSEIGAYEDVAYDHSYEAGTAAVEVDVRVRSILALEKVAVDFFKRLLELLLEVGEKFCLRVQLSAVFVSLKLGLDVVWEVGSDEPHAFVIVVAIKDANHADVDLVADRHVLYNDALLHKQILRPLAFGFTDIESADSQLEISNLDDVICPQLITLSSYSHKELLDRGVHIVDEPVFALLVTDYDVKEIVVKSHLRILALVLVEDVYARVLTVSDRKVSPVSDVGHVPVPVMDD